MTPVPGFRDLSAKSKFLATNNKKKSTADYKRLIGLTYVGLCELEMAFLAEDEGKADAAIDKLKTLKKDGHRAYTED